MADWQPIEVTRVEVPGLNPMSEHYLDVVLHLSAAPPPGWAQRFGSGGVSVPMNLRAAWRLEGSSIRFPAEDSDLEAWVAKTKECVALANEEYETQVLPDVLAREKADRERQAERDRRVEEARRRAENL